MAYTLVKPHQLIEKIKKSRFIVNAAPIYAIDEAMQFITQISDLTATHNCWAWKLGQQYRFNDDGEPTSTAGRPILSAIEGQDCDQVVVVVTRFFGGIKLGAGGLIRAYGGSANHCLQQAERSEIILRITCHCQCLYAEWSILENRLQELDAIIEQQHFDATGTQLQLAVTADRIAPLQLLLRDLTRGREALTIV